VILDNASRDGSAELAASRARSDPRIRVVRNPETLPFTENWNRALRLVDPAARYIKVVHADDWLRPTCLERMVSLAEANPEVGLVGSWVERGDEVVCRWPEAPGRVIPGALVSRLSLLGEIPYVFGSPTSLLLRADPVRAADPLYEEDGTETLGQVVDQDVCLRLLRDWDFGYVPEVLTATREHDRSLTSQNEEIGRWYAGKIALHQRHGPTYLNADEYDRRLREWIDEYHRYLGAQLLQGRGPRFWRFHRRALGQLGLDMSVARIATHAGRKAVRRLLRRVTDVGPARTTPHGEER